MLSNTTQENYDCALIENKHNPVVAATDPVLVTNSNDPKKVAIDPLKITS